MVDPLPVPAQLEAQLGKCKSVREATYYKSRVRTAAVRCSLCLMIAIPNYGSNTTLCSHSAGTRYSPYTPLVNMQEMEASKAKLPPLPQK
jgi:hypothetical protein